ncbi:hypothetical protein [Paenibacillus guangzhouensis]|uniref:hypothetical protein n=1 Tax=Paenibacillus guangzhouensis TaxID=1473112 RepID=UPI001266BF0B|nr:hypothetical protein [Paenibacillus guangzhouensis]
MTSFELDNQMRSMNLLETAWRAYTQNFWKILIIILIVAVPVEALIFVIEAPIPENAYGPLILINLLSSAILTIIPAAIISMIFLKIEHGEEIGIGAAFRRGRKYWFKLMLYMIIVRIMTSIGLLLLIIPGIVIGTRMLFVQYVIMLEGTYGNNPIGRSNDMVKGRTGQFFLIAAGIGLAQMGCNYLFQTYVHLDSWLLNLVTGMLSELFFEFMTVLFFIAYLYIRKYENPERIITFDE